MNFVWLKPEEMEVSHFLLSFFRREKARDKRSEREGEDERERDRWTDRSIVSLSIDGSIVSDSLMKVTGRLSVRPFGRALPIHKYFSSEKT